MKFSFAPISSFGELLLVTTAAAIALGAVLAKAPTWTLAFSYSGGALAHTTQDFTQVIRQALAETHSPFEQVSGRNLQRDSTDILNLLSRAEVCNKDSDNPPPVPGSPGGSR
ncbi:hypothetical protein [Allocoleopsis sp.]|uniref:hypothetical protein n=1 Tax=Allocoleopsis sp. TaxID=3088169 RepID=UPI002FD27583